MKKSKQQHIILTDDDDLVLLVISNVLSENNFKVTTFNNGPDTIEYFQNGLSADLLLIDYEMAPLTGIETVRQILTLKDVPFVFLTSHTENNIINEAGTLGAMTYILKNTPPAAIIPQIQFAILRANQLYSVSQENITNRHINIALGILAERYKITPDEAFQSLRRKARSKGQKLADLAQIILENKEKTRIYEHKIYGL